MAGLLNPDPAIDAREALLVAELRRWASTPFDLVRDNCGLAVLAYAEAVSGATIRRGRGLKGARAAGRLMATPEAFVAVVGGVMRRLGWREVDGHAGAPRRGDIGLVWQPELITAICVGDGDTGPMWAARGDRAVVIQPATALIAWSF